MTIQSWLIYLSLVVIATSSPGPAVLFIVTNSTLHGWKKSVFAACGNIAGLFILAVIAITGLGTLLKASEMIFNIVKYLGAAYLIYLGIKMILQKNNSLTLHQTEVKVHQAPPQKIFFQAFGVAMSNPKAIVFLTALFPQFIVVDRAIIPQFSILIITLMFFSFSFLMLYALLADRAKKWLTNSKRIQLVNRTSGSIFIGFGLLLAGTSNK